MKNFNHPMILSHYYASHFHHSHDRKAILQLDNQYYTNCSRIVGPHCQYHSESLETMTYHNLVKNVDHYHTISQQEDSPKKGEKRRKDEKITYVGIVSKQTLTLEVELAINKYFAERPFFSIEYVNVEKGSGIGNSLIFIVFRVITGSFQRILSAYSSLYFPSSPLTCASHPLAVDLDATGTWGNRFGITYIHEVTYPETIFMTFIGGHCSHHRGNRFASHDICPHMYNKFDCLFLPGTNCTIPTHFIDCDRSKTVQDEFLVFTNATAKGQLLLGDAVQNYRGREEVKSLPTIFKNLEAANYREDRDNGYYTQFKLKDLRFIDSNTVVKEETFRMPYLDQRGIFYLWGMHYRPSMAFRVEMEESIRQSRISSYFGVLERQETCVAIHMRKDDRQINDENMTEWCIKHTNPNLSERPTRETLPFGVSYGVWMDYGCLYRIPYGDLSLEHFLNASLAMFPDNRNIFVMTDDPRWLDRSVERVFGLQNISHAHSLEEYDRRKGEGKEVKSRYAAYDKLRVFTLASVRNDRKYEANVEFWASIELVRQCESLIIHPGSAVGRFIALSACYRSGQSRYMHCPDLLDISGGEKY
eukprot:gene10672-11625_t